MSDPENARLIRVRVEGLPNDVHAVVAQLYHLPLRVVEESQDYPNRDSDKVRRYVTVLLTGSGEGG